MYPPECIENGVIQGRLRLYWIDVVVILDHAALREAHRCAKCQFECHHGTPVSVPAAARVTTITPAGYGMQLVFGDGHVHDIYPRAYLMELVTTAAAG